MGMGHAVYKTVDPRSQVLKELSKKLSEKSSQPWYSITSKVEQVTVEMMKKTKGVEIFSKCRSLQCISLLHARHPNGS